MLAAATMFLYGPPMRRRADPLRFASLIACQPGLALARLLGLESAPADQRLAYWSVVWVGSFMFWAPISAYLYHRQQQRWKERIEKELHSDGNSAT